MALKLRTGLGTAAAAEAALMPFVWKVSEVSEVPGTHKYCVDQLKLPLGDCCNFITGASICVK